MPWLEGLKFLRGDQMGTHIYLKPGEHYFTPSGKGHSILNEQDEDLVFMALIIYDSQQKM